MSLFKRNVDVWEKLLEIGREYNCTQMTKLRCQVAVDLTIPRLFWHPKYHLRFPPDFQCMVFAFMVCNRRGCKPYLPMEVIWCVLEMLDYNTLGELRAGGTCICSSCSGRLSEYRRLDLLYHYLADPHLPMVSLEGVVSAMNRRRF
jgi:hypothetical protein